MMLRGAAGHRPMRPGRRRCPVLRPLLEAGGLAQRVGAMLGTNGRLCVAESGPGSRLAPRRVGDRWVVESERLGECAGDEESGADHITVIKQALAQLPADAAGRSRASRKVLIRADGAGSTHKLVQWLATQRLSYSVGFVLPAGTRTCSKSSTTPVRGLPPTTRTTRSATGRGSPSSPGCSI